MFPQVSVSYPQDYPHERPFQNEFLHDNPTRSFRPQPCPELRLELPRRAPEHTFG
jgi:hypothetical protein